LDASKKSLYHHKMFRKRGRNSTKPPDKLFGSRRTTKDMRKIDLGLRNLRGRDLIC